jgi:ABC transporter substrate binding protein
VQSILLRKKMDARVKPAHDGSVTRAVALGRREFISLLGGAAAAWPLAARAQQGKLPTIGFLGTATLSTMSFRVAALVQRMRELGWIDGRNVAIEYRWAEGRSEHLTQIAAEFVRLKVDVIVTQGTPPTLAAKKATAIIPIVSVVMGDPVGNDLVASLARPGGNVTGFSIQTPDIAGKRLELLREVVPGLRRVAFMGNIDNPIVPQELREVQVAADALGIEVTTLEIRRAQDIMPSFEALKNRAEALYLASEGLVDANRLRVNSWRWARGCRRCGRLGNSLKPEVCWPMDRASRTSTGARATWSTRFCVG